jgi:tetratricopeptide (TPR) repeat protein
MECTLDEALKKGVEAHRAGEIEEADGIYTAILKAQPKHPDANHNMGILAVGVGKAEEALPFFKTALEANPSIGQFWLSYADALIKLNRIADAKAVFNHAKDKGANSEPFDQLEQRLSELSLNSQDPPSNQLQPIINLYAQGQLKQALSDTTKVLKRFPNSAILYNIAGSANAGLMQYDAAIERYKQALKIKPDYAEAYYNIGSVLQSKGGLKASIDSYQQALKLKPDYAQAHNNIGVCLNDLGDVVGAIESYKRAVLIKPDHGEAYYNMGIALNDKGDLEGAIGSFKRSLKIKPGYVDAYNHMGLALQCRGDLEAAIVCYKQALQIKPDHVEAHYNMGIALNDKGDLDGSTESFKMALKVKPDYVGAAFNLSGLAKNISESKSWIEHCLHLDQGHLEAKLTLAALTFYEGDKTVFDDLMQSPLKNHPFMRSFAWVFDLPELPELFFHRWALFDYVVGQSITSRPFYEFGVWRGEAFRYLIKTFKKGYGFDTFEGIPEDWHHEKTGSYSSDGNIPQIEGGEFIVGKFDNTLLPFFSEPRPTASLINFDADLYSSTICALNHSKPVIDQHTLLVFDEFLMNDNWEDDEYKALNEFCLQNNYTYEVLAVSFITKQVAVRLVNT